MEAQCTPGEVEDPLALLEVEYSDEGKLETVEMIAEKHDIQPYEEEPNFEEDITVKEESLEYDCEETLHEY